MKWEELLQQELLGPEGKQADQQLRRVLRRLLPSFQVPTDPKQWRQESRRLRKLALQKVYLRGYEPDVLAGKAKIVWGPVLQVHPTYRIRKLRYEAYPNYWIPALLYEPTGLGRQRVPVMLNPNGHHLGGKAATYKQARCINLARRGVLALNMEFLGMGELEADRAHFDFGRLDLTGLASVGLFYLALARGLDVLLEHPNADPARCGVTGLSGGGWQSIVVGPLDPRINLTVPVAGYTSLRARIDVPEDIGDNEQAPPDMATVLDYQHLTAMLAPNPTLIITNQNDDCCFRTVRNKPVVYDAVKPTWQAMGAAEKFTWHSNSDPGTHNYDQDNRSALYRFLATHWGVTGPELDEHDEREILTDAQLQVGLPAEQLTVLRLAQQRARALAASRATPRTLAQKSKLRQRLTEVLALPAYRLQAAKPISSKKDLANWLVQVGPWSVPVTSRLVDQTIRPTLLLCDQGRKQLSRHLPPGGTIFAADIHWTGEHRGHRGRQLLLEAAGQRLLGIQVAQILALGAWIKRLTGAQHLHVYCRGPVTTTAGLIAAALAPGFCQKLSVNDSLGSLELLLDLPLSQEQAQPLFCFGLLEVADVRQLRSLLEDVELDQVGRRLKVSLGLDA